jgi:hypothetical protein
MAQRQDFVQVTLQAAAIFDFLERHRLAPTGLAQVGECRREPDRPQDQQCRRTSDWPLRSAL